MSANLINSAALAKAGWFTDLVRAAMIEYALAHPFDLLSRSLVRDPAYLVPVFVNTAADNPTISDDPWQQQSDAQKQSDVRYAVESLWPTLAGAVPNLQPQLARVPVLPTDPSMSSAISIWIDSATGQLRARGDDETVRSYSSAAA